MKWKNYTLENACYFITITVRKFVPLFQDGEVVRILFNSLEFLRHEHGLKVYAYVVMPNHIHLVAGCDAKIMNNMIGNFKSYTSRSIAEYLELNKSQLLRKFEKSAYKGQNYAIWQETFRSEVVFSEDFLKQKVDYIHNNPVKAGLVELVDDWQYSSYRQLEGDVLSGNAEFVFKVDAF
jgi:REP element-mobilizing transposase RayT